MSTLWSKSGSIEFDGNGERAAGARAYFFQGGTTTPLTVYEDADETTPHAEYVEANGIGRWPTVFIPFVESYDVKATTAGGTQLYYPTDIPNPDPIDATEVSTGGDESLQTGDVIWSPKNAARDGFVRLNARTIGAATSSATERANADTVDLFVFLWDNVSDAICPVTPGGRGVSALTDFAANKTIKLLDARSAGLFGLSDMGNSSDGLLASTTFTNGSATTAGSWCGGNTQTLLTANLPTVTVTGTISQITPAGTVTATGTISQITPAGTITITDPGHAHGYQAPLAGVTNIYQSGVNHANAATANTNSATTGITASFAGTPVTPTFTGNAVSLVGTPVTPTFTGNPFGSGTAHNNVAKSILGTFYQKL